jgi:ABC-2 type transport system permease protein
MLASPVSLSEFLLSKMIRCFLLCAATQFLLLFASALLFGINWGNPLLLVPGVLACALSVTGLLAFIYATARTKEQAYSLSHVIVIVCALVGGSFFPFENMPAFLQAIGRFSPNRWGVLVIQTVAWSQPSADLVDPLVFLCALGLLGSAIAFFVFCRRLGKGAEAQ